MRKIGNADIAGLAQELLHRQVAEKVTAHPIEWHDRSAVVPEQTSASGPNFVFVDGRNLSSQRLSIIGNSAAPTGTSDQLGPGLQDHVERPLRCSSNLGEPAPANDLAELGLTRLRTQAFADLLIQ